MKVKANKVKNGVDISISCEFCGEPITETSTEYGMDCKNGCYKKEYLKIVKWIGRSCFFIGE